MVSLRRLAEHNVNAKCVHWPNFQWAFISSPPIPLHLCDPWNQFKLHKQLASAPKPQTIDRLTGHTERSGNLRGT